MCIRDRAAYLPVKGLQQLIKTILTVKKRLNRKLAIEGILLTMVDFRTNYARDIASRVHTTYGSQIEVFENVIPMLSLIHISRAAFNRRSFLFGICFN